MRVDDFLLEVRDSSLRRVGQFTADDLTDTLVVPAANAVGAWEMNLPQWTRDEDGRLVQHRLCALLREPGAGLIVTGPGGHVLSGPMEEAAFVASPANPGSWKITGVSDLCWIEDDVAYGDPAHDLPGQVTSNDVRTAAAETLVYDYISRNIGPLARAARRNTRLVLAPNLGRGPSVTKSPRFQDLLELVQEILTGTGLLIDVVPVGTNLEVRVRAAVNRSGKIRMDQENDQLTSTEFSYRGPTVTDVIVAGQEEGTARTLLLRTGTDGGYGRRRVMFLDQRNTDDLVELQQAGDKELADAAEQRTAFQVVPNTDLDLVYGVDWTVGDIVTVSAAGVPLSAQVSTAPIKFSPDGVFVGATIGSPSGSTWEDQVDAVQRSTVSRLARLERSL